MNYRCGHCKYEGPCYGTPHSGGLGHEAGVSAPWCHQCGRNDALVKMEVVGYSNPQLERSDNDDRSRLE